MPHNWTLRWLAMLVLFCLSAFAMASYAEAAAVDGDDGAIRPMIEDIDGVAD